MQPEFETGVGPCAGLRVIDMSSLVSGPFCGQILADLGADVIKVESAGSDPHQDPRPMVRDHGAHRCLFRAGAQPERGAAPPAERRARGLRRTGRRAPAGAWTSLFGDPARSAARREKIYRDSLIAIAQAGASIVFVSQIIAARK